MNFEAEVTFSVIIALAAVQWRFNLVLSLGPKFKEKE